MNDSTSAAGDYCYAGLRPDLLATSAMSCTLSANAFGKIMTHSARSSQSNQTKGPAPACPHTQVRSVKIFWTAAAYVVCAADLQGLIAYLGIMAMLRVAVAWASHRDRQKERQKKRALATKAAVAENGKTGRAVADVKRRRAA